PTPADVDNADRPPRHMTLQEAIAISLENGATVRGGTTSGQADDGMLAGQISGLVLPGNSSDRIRVLALNPAIVTASLEESLARFDAVWVSSMNWTTTDNLTQGLSSFSNGQDANVNTAIVKAFSAGGSASVGFRNEYRFLTQPPTGFGVFNPFYTS